MKLSISLLLLTTSIHATPIQIYFEQGQKMEAAIYQDILIKDYLIPEDLITKSVVADCEEKKRRAELELCIKNNGDLTVVSVDKNFIRESLSVFRAP